MTVKVIVKEPKSDGEIEYPCLMTGSSGIIVAFHKESNGVVLKGTDTWSLFEYSSTFGMDNFKPFNGTLELEND